MINSVHPEDRRRCLEVYSSAFDGRSCFSMVYRLRRKHREYRWIQDDGCPRYDSRGDFIGYIGFCLDITAQKEMEKHLEKYRELFCVSEELNKTGSWEMSVVDSAVLWSPGVYRIHGLDPVEGALADKSLMDMTVRCLREEDRDGFLACLTRCRDEGAGFEITVAFRDLKGKEKRIVARAKALAKDGRIDMIAGTFTEI